MAEAPYDPYLGGAPAGSAPAKAPEQGNQRTAALQAVS